MHVHPAIEPGPPYSMLTTADQHRKSRSLVVRCAVACLALAAFLLSVAPSSFAQTCTNPQNPPSIQDCIWSDTAVPTTVDDGGTSSIEVGVKFTASVSGYVSGTRFYKSTANTGTHVGNLWSSAGTLLATATFASETASGWQQVNFSTPVAITAGTTYVASYFTSVGHTADDHGYFTSSGFSNGPLQALQSSLSGGNGVYITSSQTAFPTNDNQNSNYWVDVVFLPTMNLTFNSRLIMGGASATGIITLASAAPSGGSTVTLTSSNTAVATVPASVVVSSGSTAATFTLTTSAVSASNPVTISATYGGTNQVVSLTIAPSTGRLVQWTSGDSGSATSETTYLGSSVAAGDLLLVLSHWDNPAALASATDNAGNTYVPIGGPIYKGPDAVVEAWYAKNVNGGPGLGVTVTYSAQTWTISDVDASEYSGLDTAAPLDVFAGQSGAGVTPPVNLGGSGEINSGPSATTTASYETIVGLIGTAYDAPFTAGAGFTLEDANASTVLEDRSVNAKGSYNATAMAGSWTTGDSWAAIVVGFKNAFQAGVALSLNPAVVTGGNPSTGTVTLNTVAPAGGTTVTLSSNNTAVATVPASVTVAAGATTVTFTVTTLAVSASTPVTIAATDSNGDTGTATLTVNPPPPTISGLTLNPTTVTGGLTSTGTVTLGGPALPGGVVVTLSSSNTALATVPASVTVAAGSASATFTVSTTAVSASTQATISGTENGSNGTSNLTVIPPSLLSFSLSPAAVIGGATSTGTVTLNSAAPVGGSVITLSSSNTAVATVPASVTVAAGATSATFTVNTSVVATSAQVTIKGTDSNNDIETFPFTVNPASASSLSLLSLNPTSVTGGRTSTGTVTLSSAAPTGGAAVSLSSSSASATVPGSVTVAAGATTATFTVTTTAVSSTTSAIISGSYNGTQTATLTVTPSVVGTSGFPWIPYDMWIDFEQCTSGSAPTSACLAASTHGTAGAWDTSTMAGLITIQTAGQPTPTGDTGTLGMAYNLANGGVGYITWSPPNNLSMLSFGMWYKTGEPASWTEGPHFITLNNWSYGNMERLSDERSSSTNSRQIRVSPLDNAVGGLADNTWYWVTMQWVQGGTGSFSVYDASLNLVGTVSFTDSINYPVQAIELGDANGTGGEAGETTYFDDLIVEYTNPIFPVLPEASALTLSSVSLSPTTVTGGTSSTGTVTLSSAAPTGGAVVTLGSSSASATVPASVTVAAGATTATFTVTTTAVSSTTSVTISGAYNGTQTATLTINPPAVTLSSVSLNPTTVTGGTSSTGTVTLSSAAPTGGAVVTLGSSSASATVPASVTVAAGATTATFTVTTTAVSSTTPATISGTYNGGTQQTATLTINPPTLSSVSLSPSNPIGGASSTGTVTLSAAAPAGGVVVTLTSNNTSTATVPASVTVAAGATTATFTITTTPVASNTTVSISATLNGTTKSANLTVREATPSSVSLSPSSVIGGTSSTGTVTLNGAALSGGTVVTLTSSNTSAATVPSSVTVAAGATTATFTITTTPVSANTKVTISAALNGTTKTASLTVDRPALTSLTLSPSSVTGGTSSTGTVTLSGPAPSAGTVVTLSDNKAAATVPASVTVPAGTTTATFTVTTTAVTASISVTVSSKLNGTTETATLTVAP